MNVAEKAKCEACGAVGTVGEFGHHKCTDCGAMPKCESCGEVGTVGNSGLKKCKNCGAQRKQQHNKETLSQKLGSVACGFLGLLFAVVVICSLVVSIGYITWDFINKERSPKSMPYKLKACNDCKRTISKKAPSCPFCGTSEP